MRRLSRPWGRDALSGAYGPGDCLLTEVDAAGDPGRSDDRSGPHDVIMEGAGRRLLLHPYPRGASAEAPPRAGFPVRPPRNQEPQTEAEHRGAEALARMNQVLGRVQELEEALDDPSQVWPRLRAAWDRAQDEENPRMAEIVRQARDLKPVLQRLEETLRRVLRRARETVPLDRAQEIDRASMLWLARRPGRSPAERAGPEQRVLATVRRENFDTPENRVLRAYAELAAAAARVWLREHARARAGERWRRVEAHARRCRALARELETKGVRRADPDIQPNYVLTQDPDYRAVHEAWIRLLKQDRELDDLWAWQAQAWTDFCVLALVLSLDALEEAEMVACAPILWRDEAVHGRRFEQGNPLATFWLRETNRIVDIHARSRGKLDDRRALSRAQAFLTVSTPGSDDFPRHIAVWTPHAMEPIALQFAAGQACDMLDELQRIGRSEILRDGLILTPSHGTPDVATAVSGRVRVEAIGFDAAGRSLGAGLDAIAAALRGDIWSRET